MWKPETLEDCLLQAYSCDHPGSLYLEVPVGGNDPNHRPRRIDGVLVDDGSSRILARDQYSGRELRDSVSGSRVQVIEAKKGLNRPVIGQVIAGRQLLSKEYSPSAIVSVALVAEVDDDLLSVCDELDIDVCCITGVQPSSSPSSNAANRSAVDGRTELRKSPDPGRREAFLRGWSDATWGRLYRSVRNRRTHQNMGNLFGWIYGDQPEEFRRATWERYVAQLEDELTGD